MKADTDKEKQQEEPNPSIPVRPDKEPPAPVEDPPPADELPAPIKEDNPEKDRVRIF